MCSIPGRPTPGTEVHVLITRVHLNTSCGLVEIWVNMDDGRKHIYEQMRDETQITVRKFCGSEGKPGDLCLVRLSDVWHRARIVSFQSETYDVFLIDQGQTHSATSEALAWAQSEIFLLPPETEACILANVILCESAWPERTTKFFKFLPGKKFKGVVQHVLMPDSKILLDIPTVTKSMCKSGVLKSIPGDEFKRLVQQSLPNGEVSEAHCKTQEHDLNGFCQLDMYDQYFYPELLTDTFETVIVTQVTDPQHIFCKLFILSKAVKILSEQIQGHYQENLNYGEVQPQTCGDPCAAKGANGRWHRSLLKQNVVTADGVVEVLHVDEGKTERIPGRDIRPLHGKFLRMPVVTYLCSLDGLEGFGKGWTKDQTDCLKSMLLNQSFIASFDHHNVPQEAYCVTLYAADAACMNTCFLQKQGLFQTPEHKSNVLREPIPSAILSSLGDKQGLDLQNQANVQDCTRLSNIHLDNTSRMDGEPTSATGDIQYSEHPDPPIHNSTNLCGFPCEEHNACVEDLFAVGSRINVKVTCIESPLKFWCQYSENADSLRLLMRDLQNHYASAQPQPLVESICVVRNPDNGMWYRAKMTSSADAPVVDVRFIDYGGTRKIPLRDVRPIHPIFLRLNAQAFQCCLFNLKNSSLPTAATWADAALVEFQHFVDLCADSNTGLKCVVKAVTSDEEGLLLNMVDIETPTDSVCKRLALKLAQTEARMKVPPQVPLEEYKYSTHNIEVGGKEEVLLTSSESVSHFYCQLVRNSHLVGKVTETVKNLIGQPQSTIHPFGLNSICFAKYTDNQWYRGRIVEMSPKLKVHFVDYGDTLPVKQSDICPFHSEESSARSVPVQAIPLGLFDVPEKVPLEINQWFSDHATGCNFTISVVSIGETGKLLVDLLQGSINVNVKVRERICRIEQKTMSGSVQQKELQVSNSTEPVSVHNECLIQDLNHLQIETEQRTVQSSNGKSPRDEPMIRSKSTADVFESETDPGEILTEKRPPTLGGKIRDQKTETFIQDDHSDSEVTQVTARRVNTYMYKRPNVSQNQTEEVYASCIGGPDFFWCQYTNTEDLNMVSRLAQDAAKTEQDMMFLESLGPGSPCLALFSSDNQWYRAQVLERTDNSLHVVFVDYGNESDVEIQNVRSLPQSLLEMAPQAFLCSLNGFDESKGSWEDQVYEDFYNLLVDKTMRVTVFNMEDHSEMKVPQCAVDIECENVVVNSAMKKYWKENIMTENLQTENLPQESQTESNVTNLNVSIGEKNTSMYKKPKISKNQMEDVYASCIVGPNFFWCQYANNGELSNLSLLVQDAARSQQEKMLPESLGPGSPCLALFSSDNQWYRAQVLQRTDNSLHVVFVDYGNESDVEIQNVRSMPQSLLEMAPQAFLCSLNGFDESKGSWEDQVYEDFYNILVDQPLIVTVFNMEVHSEMKVPQCAVDVECENVVVNSAMKKYWKENIMTENLETENPPQDGQTESNITLLNVPNVETNTSMYKQPKVSKNQTEEVYASCIGGPDFFWCQYTNTEDLNMVSRLAQDAAKTEQDMMFLESLGPGSPCLALFSSDNQWYRAQVLERTDNSLHVVFVDYGNESDVEIQNVRSLPQSLLEMAPQAFLCSLNGFDESKGSWEDQVYEDFYNLLVDKTMRVTVFNMEVHSEIKVPQYAVDVECDGVDVNTLMETHCKGLDTDHALAEGFESVNLDETKTGDSIASK